jgi:hypothetical protein
MRPRLLVFLTLLWCANVALGAPITIMGTDGDDVLEITPAIPGVLEFTLFSDGSLEGAGTLPAGSDVSFMGGNGNDLLIVGSSGPEFGDLSINYDGGGNGGVGDALDIFGGFATRTTYTATDASSGTVDFSSDISGTGTTITYTGLEPIFDGNVSDTVIFDFQGPAEIITLSELFPGQFGIDSTSAESVQFAAPISRLVVLFDEQSDVFDNQLGPSLGFEVVINPIPLPPAVLMFASAALLLPSRSGSRRDRMFRQ